MKIQLIRHATTLLTYHQKTFLIDPVFSPKGALSAIEGVPNTQSNPLVDLPFQNDSDLLSALQSCDAILVTHTHRDHFDIEALIKLMPSLLDIPVFCQPGDPCKIKEAGFTNVQPIASTLNWDGIQITRTKGRHGHGAIAVAMGTVSGFVFQAEAAPTVYLTGDTVWCTHVRKALEQFQPEVTITYCGEARFGKGKPITMNAKDVAHICNLLPKSQVVAVHMEAWNHCRLTRAALKAYATEAGFGTQVFIPENGDVIDFTHS